ncbi:MAG: DJ-1/PfpI family protein [Sedimentisphaerales bacterium]|nr:DJ-1/PfpI family protein [Sedimentisphaerales bacterium]
MKRLVIFTLALALFVVPCSGQRRSRPTARKLIQLTEPDTEGAITLQQALAKRRSVTQFTNEALKPSDISQLAWAGQGITETQKGLRTAPSLGEIYPIDLIFVTQEGTFTYDPTEHRLEQLSDQDIRISLASATSMPESVAGAPCSIILAGSTRKMSERFPDKARTYIYLEAGHIAQNIELQATALDLGSVAVAVFNTANVRKTCKLPRNEDPLYIVCVGHPATEGTVDADIGQIGAAGKKAALIIASQDFQDEELFGTKRVLDAAQMQTVIASTRRGVKRGVLGNLAEASVPIDRLKVQEYDAIIFIGGVGAAEYVMSPTALNVARETVRNGKVLAAIGVAPTILANAGVLAGIRATSFPSEQGVLIQANAIYTGNPVERDRFIITANSPAAAVPFARVIVETVAVR